MKKKKSRIQELEQIIELMKSAKHDHEKILRGIHDAVGCPYLSQLEEAVAEVLDLRDQLSSLRVKTKRKS
jgi:hypothetical protein